LFAAQAAIAIENARLHGAAVRRGEELRALLRSTQTVMAELDLQVILERIVRVNRPWRPWRSSPSTWC
jgi:GAF domain-containing protein